VNKRLVVLAVACVAGFSSPSFAEPPPGEAPALGSNRITQGDVTGGTMTLREVRLEGLRIFTTLFNKLDGYGDGPMDVADPVTPGGRPTLQGNGTLLRVNGLDGRSCLECHAMVSAATSPPRLGIGGVGGSNSNAIIMPTNIDMGDPNVDGSVIFNGRFANPPFVFGAGAVELLAAEMTQDLQALKALAQANPGTPIALESKGVSFGTVVADAQGDLDTTQVGGVDPDLVVRPFGRKGEFFSIRDFDIGAMRFHFGMQPVEAFPGESDPDGDGIEDEILAGELSVLSAFIATLERPFAEPLSSEAEAGFGAFQEIGCASCHIPALETRGKEVQLRFPEEPTDPDAHVFLSIDLTEEPMSFEGNDQGGIRVPLFADLKRHDMGDGLAESFDRVSEQTNREFTTARLWGIADTAPYLHDGRATTLTEAILAHGGEAQIARNGFEALDDQARTELLEFLRSLRTPEAPVEALLASADDDDDEDDDDDGMGDNSDSGIDPPRRLSGGLLRIEAER
jgi:hypothetical protein